MNKKMSKAEKFMRAIPRDVIWEADRESPILKVRVTQHTTSDTTYENRMIPICALSKALLIILNMHEEVKKDYLSDKDMIFFHQEGYNIILN
tara:strand:+ start:295 stop:570 length:276 start_codon:yes stop_codon:yes gene_type:complete